ncbi:serine/threonine-protein kinase [Catenulispora subtropica]
MQRTIGNGRYALVQPVASGGMGTVWKGFDTTLHRTVAIKEVSLELIAPKHLDEYITRAVNEGRNAARLADHPNIVTVYDVVIENGVPWTVMQYVEGESLAQAAAVPDVVQVARQLLEAVAFAHAAGIVHRDIKPANIMVRAADGRVLLTDFGIAKDLAAGDQSLTVAGGVLGTASYMAPERLQGRDAGPASDMWSLGVVLFEVVERYNPFAEDTRSETIAAVLTARLPEMRRCRPDDTIGQLIRALTMNDPAQRPDARTALGMIEAASHSGPAPAAQTGGKGPVGISAPWHDTVTAPIVAPGSADEREGRADRPRRRWMAVTGVLVLIAAGLGVSIPVVFTHHHGSSKGTTDGAACGPGAAGVGASPVDLTPGAPGSSAPPATTPHPPTATFPADQAKVQVGQPVQFRWTGASKISEVAISFNNGDFKFYPWAPESSFCFTPTTAGVYTWMVASASSANGIASSWSEQRGLIAEPDAAATANPLSDAPHPPTPVSPTDQTTITVGQPVTFTWTTTGFKSALWLETPDGHRTQNSWQTSTTYTFTPTVPGVYLWMVTAAADHTGATPSGFSEERMLVVKPS